jgi:hypothetical protein
MPLFHWTIIPWINELDEVIMGIYVALKEQQVI